VKEYGTQNLDWLPVKLPENVKIIFSVADDSSVFAEIKKKITDSAALIAVSIVLGYIFINVLRNQRIHILSCNDPDTSIISHVSMSASENVAK
jgi:hypothetical protein